MATLNLNVKVAINHSDVLRIMQSSKVLFFPSYVENFGNVIVEAISCGCLPLVFDDTHWRSLIDHHASLTLSGFQDLISSYDDPYDTEMVLNAQKYVWDEYISTSNPAQVLDFLA